MEVRRLPNGLLIGQRVKLTTDVYYKDECLGRHGVSATVVERRAPGRPRDPKEWRAARYSRGEGSFCVELADGSRIGVWLSEVDHCLPGAWKARQLVVFSKDQNLSGKVVARRGDRGLVHGLSRQHPRKCICIQRYGDYHGARGEIDVSLKELLAVDKGKSWSLGSDVTIDVENSEDNYDPQRVGTEGSDGVVLETGVEREGESFTSVRLQNGSVLLYNDLWLTAGVGMPVHIGAPSHSLCEMARKGSSAGLQWKGLEWHFT